MGILRFVLALSVVIAHSSSIFGLSFVGGQVAVQSFHIISGFYMSLILNEKYIGANSPYKLYITNRLYKIYPIYWVTLLITTVGSIALLMYTHGSNWGRLDAYAKYIDSIDYRAVLFLIFTNIFIFFQDIVLFLGLDTSTGLLFFTSNFRQTSPQLHTFLLIPQAWTLGIELMFYLIAPFIVKRRVEVIVLIIIISLFLRRILSYYGMDSDPWTYRFFPTELLFFLLGTISYKIYKKLHCLGIKARYLTLIWTCLLFFTFVYDHISIPNKYEVYLITFFICLPFVFLLTRSWRVDRYIGELSYPMYVIHLFVLACMKVFKYSSVSELGLSLAIVTTIFSILLNQFVTKRVEKIRQGRLLPIIAKGA